MQTKKTDAIPSSLRQGHIFRLNEVVFSVQKKNPQTNTIESKDFKFEDFYPEVDITNIEYGVVLTQSCDLEQCKVSHITIGLLEKFNRHADLTFSIEDEKKVFTQVQPKTFYNMNSLVEVIGQRAGSVFRNRDASLLFLSVSERANQESYFIVNLTKIFPVKINHASEIARHVCFEVIGDFRALLGWKLANLFGRIGVNEYSDVEIKKISSALSGEIVGILTDRFKEKNPGTSFVEIKKEDVFKKLKEKVVELNSKKGAATPNQVKISQIESSIIDLIQSDAQ